MPYLQHFFIEGQYIGSAERHVVRVHESVQPPWSMIFYCERCGDVYAKAPIELGRGPKGGTLISRFQSYSGLCRRHPPTHMFAEIPGSIWKHWDHDFIAALPMPVLRWELERHLDAYERLENHE